MTPTRDETVMRASERPPAEAIATADASLERFRAVITFERDRGDPVCVRLPIVASSPDDAVRRAVFRAFPEAARIKWESVVIVLDRLGPARERDNSDSRALDRQGKAPRA